MEVPMYVDFSPGAATTVARAGTAPLQATSDESLMSHVARGDRDAMRALYLRHQMRVHRFVMRLVRNQAVAEDVISDVFLDVWRQAGRFEGRPAGSTRPPAHARFQAPPSPR